VSGVPSSLGSGSPWAAQAKAAGREVIGDKQSIAMTAWLQLLDAAAGINAALQAGQWLSGGAEWVQQSTALHIPMAPGYAVPVPTDLPLRSLY
jgi:hypothetical protein